MRYRIHIAQENEVGGVTRRKLQAASETELLAWIQGVLSEPDRLIAFEINVLVRDTQEIKR